MFHRKQNEIQWIIKKTLDQTYKIMTNWAPFDFDAFRKKLDS